MPNDNIMNSTDSNSEVTLQNLKNLQNDFQSIGFSVSITNTDSPEAKILSIQLPTQPIAFRSLIHFDDQDHHENTLEDGSQVIETLKLKSQQIAKQTGRKSVIDYDTLKRDIGQGGFNVYKGHLYVETNQAYFFRDLFNLAQILIYTERSPQHYLKFLN